MEMGLFDQIPDESPDGSFAMIEAFKADSHDKKVNLSPGIYRDENAKTWVLPSVKQVRLICTYVSFTSSFLEGCVGFLPGKVAHFILIVSRLEPIRTLIMIYRHNLDCLAWSLPHDKLPSETR